MHAGKPSDKKKNKMNPPVNYDELKKENLQGLNKVALDKDSEREAVVFCKRGQRKQQLLQQKSTPDKEHAKQSLVEAREPSPEVISRASYLRSNEMNSDKKSSIN